MKQTTIKIGEDKIKIRVNRKLSTSGNLSGYSVWVNDKKYFFMVLTEKEAFDKGYAKYIKENR